MKKLLLMWIALLTFGVSFGQTVLISNVGNGGFENGTTPAANGWTAVNSATDGWYVGAAPVVSNGTNCGFISSTAGTDWTYSQNSVTQHIYYDVTIPAGESKLALTFKWKVGGEGTTTSDWDNMKVFFGTVTNIGTPVANTAISATYQISGPGAVSGMYKLSSAAWNTETINLIGIPGETYRLVFSWKSDFSFIANPPAAIDDVLLLSTAPDPLHGLYTINNLAPTSAPMVHDGTGNFASFTAAINHMNSEGVSGPVMFAVVAGQTFAEDCPVINATGTSTNTITFTRAGAGANPVVTPTGTTGTTDAGFTINGGDYFTFNGIDVMIASGSAMEYGYYIKNASATDGAQYNTIANCKVTLNRANTAARGISQYTPISATNASGANSYNIYHKNIIENCYHGIQLTGTSSTYPDINCVIDSNIVGAATANDIGGGSSAANGIRANYQQNITIFGNIVRNVTASSSVYGIYAQYLLGTDNNIGNNIVYSINMTGTETTTYVYGLRTDINSGAMANIFNNMVSDLNHGITTASSNVVVRGIGAGLTGTGTSNIVHNSVLISEDAAASSAALYLGSSGTHNVLNNVFANTSATDATSKRYCIYRTTGATLYSDYNDLFVDAAGTNNYAGYFTADRNTLADWQTASSQDAHSISVDPTFNGLTDLHTTNAALNGSGMAIAAVTEDIDGDARDAMFPDMGADENLLPPTFSCVLPTPGNTISSKNNLCLGESITLSLQNATPGTGVSYQWQSSSDGVTYSDLTGKTSVTCVVTPSVETYYQCVVTCMNGPSTGISTPVHITFANAVTGTTPATRCGTGTVSLQATGTAGTTIEWFDTQVGGTLLGTGSPWTTPIISSTTSYYVAADLPLVTGNIVGAGASTSTGNESPFYHLYGGLKTQYLFLASELTASGLTAGNIVSLALNVAAAGTSYSTLNIGIGSTTNTAMTTTFVTGLSNVYSDALFTPVNGINIITFAAPYTWDGTSNIVVEFCWSNNNTGGTSTTVKYDNPGFVSEAYYRADSQTPAVLCGTLTGTATLSARPQMYFNRIPACASARVEVVATIGSSPALTLTADQTACNNGIAQIDVTSTLTDYDSYTWTPVTDLFTDAACTTPYVGGASATTVYLKSTTAGSHEIICSANNSGTGCANMDTTHVIVLPSAVTATAANDEFCLTGSTSISITPATGWGDATFQWMESTDNATFSDIVGANAISYTTPVITDTMYYKMVVELGAAVCTESNVVTLIVKNPEVLSSTPDSRCGVGTLSLEATTTPGTQLYWFDASTGGNLVGTGSPFTTPVISASTTYYAEAAYDNLANVTATIGTGTSVSSTNAETPFTTYYEDGRHQYLILASELTAAGLQAGSVNSISFEIGAVGGSAMSNFNIQMGATSLTALTTTYETGLSSVYSNAAYTFAGTGWQTIALSTPFIWDGTSNVVVQVCFDNSSYSSNTTVYYTTTATNLHHYGYTDGSTGCTMTAPSNNGLDNIRPNMKFDAVTGTYCGSLRTPVVATIGAAPALTITPDSTICNNAVLALNVTSNIPDFDSYVWTPEANLYTDAACTTPYTTGASATTVYIKTTSAGAYEIYCSAINSGTGCTNIDTTTIVVIPGTPVATASPEEICTSGTAAITITPATGWDIATFQWMESTDNVTFSDIVGANAISYTTPVITDTMYYKMVVELGAAVCTESNVVTINVNNPQVVSTTPATRCGEGTVTLNATGNTGTELHWYDVATGGMSLATGTSFTTPSISATTSYWVDASYVDIAAGTVEIGTGTTYGTDVTYSPLYTFYETSKQQILYLASELQAAGLGAGSITSIAFNVSSISTIPMTNFEVSMGTTTLSALTTTFETGLTSVYTSAAYTPAGTGWQTITFTTPFNWDGTSNIVLQVCDGNNTGYATGSGVYYSSTPFVSHHYAYGDDLTGCSSTTFTGNYTSSYRANTRFNGQVVTACTSPRTEVIATVTTPPAITVTATPATICLNETTDLEATSSNTGYSYIWEPGTLSGATQTVTPTGTTTYNVTASDNSGGANDGCVATGSVLVTVNPIPTNVIASASDSSICLGSAFDLSSSATSGADVIINYNEGFEAWPPADWTFINAGTGNNWASSTSFHTGASGMSYSWNSTSPANAWGITGSQSLQAGTQYTISFWYMTGSTYAEKMKVTVGTGATVSDQSTVLWDNAGGTQLLTSTWTQGTVTYTPTVSDDYYFGFNCYSDANMYVLYIDDVSISGSTLNPATYSWTSSPAGYTSAVQNPTGVTPSVNTQYIVTAQNIFGCVASDDVAVTVNPIPVVNLGSDQAICDTTTITLDAGNAGSTYDWSTGGTAQTEDILGSDLGVGANTVTVDVTSAAGCIGTGSVVITVTVCEGIEDPSMQISYYPNPATNMLNLDLSELPTGDYRFELLNMQGQKVMDKILVNDGTVISVNLMDIAPGSYVISVSGNNNTFRSYLSIQE